MMFFENDWLVVVAALAVAAVVRWPRPKPEPPVVDDAKKDPLAGLRPLPGMTQSSGEPPEDVRAALMEIVADAIRTNSLHRHWDLTGLQAGGFPLGSYRITIEKTA